MDNILHVLIIEGSEDDTQSLVRELSRMNYEIQFKRVTAKNDLKNALNMQWDVVLSAYSLPELDGMEALKIVKEKDESLPFIFVLGTPNEVQTGEAMDSDANNFVFKGNLKRLVPAVERAVNDLIIKRERNIIAHDLNNALMIIQGYLAFLRIDLTGDEEHTQQIDHAFKATQNAIEIIKKLIAFSNSQPLRTASKLTGQLPNKPLSTLYGNETILIAEDEETLRKLTVKFLESLGYRVLQTENGETALQMLQQKPTVKILLTDIIMPGDLTGPQLVKKALELNPNLKIVYMSGYTKEVLQNVHHLNTEKYPILIKPFSRLDLATLLRDMLN